MMELLAPGGSFEAVVAAVQSGADAVYIGGSKFSARHGAKNFDNNEIIDVVKYCHLRGVSVHAAANILVKPNEVKEFIEYLGFLNAAGVDAVIIQDIGMAKTVKQIYPDLPLHASTQMTAASLAAVEYLKEAGFSRVVLARELSGEQIRYICKHTDIEIEVFVHGAICMSYSGQCLMSSIIGGRSGNRGMCAQPCRLPYKLVNQKSVAAQGYLLSPKDMALAEHLEELKRCGVASLKIEGRLKRPEYVAAVTGIYRKYIDYPQKILKEDLEILNDSFSRSGFTDGYFTGKTGIKMMSGEIPGNTSKNIFKKEIIKRCTADEKKIGIDIECVVCKDKKLCIEVKTDKYFASAESNVIVQKALNKPVTKERIEEQLNKLGDSVFFARNIRVITEDDVNIPIKEINAARRKAVEVLEGEILKREKRRAFEFKVKDGNKVDRQMNLTAQVFNKDQLKICEKEGIKTIYIPQELIFCAKSENIDYAVVLPEICDNDNVADIPKNFGVLISNAGQEKIYEKYKKYGNSRLNVFNAYSLDCFEGYESVMLSPELNLKEISQISGNVPTEVIAYGKIPLMIMKNCPVKSNAGKCAKNGGYILKDRKNEEFKIVCDGACHSVILNSKNIFMADKINDLKKTGVSNIRLNFYDETADEVSKVINEYKSAIKGENIKSRPENSFTRGHFYRGTL